MAREHSPVQHAMLRGTITRGIRLDVGWIDHFATSSPFRFETATLYLDCFLHRSPSCVAGHTTERVFHSIFNFQSYRKTRRGQDYQDIQRRRCYTFSPDAGGS